ncbi:MAG: hypothetical protein HOP11_04920 [Saprospiraceae bacterium]|nr:hypothetical protein [Saprospiraceae bacterium]
MGRNQKIIFFACALTVWFQACQKPEIPDNPFDDYNPKQDTVKFTFKDPDSASIAGLYTYIFKPTCANAGCHDGTFDPDFRTLESSYNTLVYREAIKQDGKYFVRVKPYSPDESVILARLNNIVTPQMPVQIEPDSDWGKNKSKYIQLIETWIRNGAVSIDGSIPKDGLPMTQLHGCYAIYKDTGIIKRIPFNGPLLLNDSIDTIDLYLAFKHNGQDPLSFSVNEIRFSQYAHIYDSTQMIMNLELVQPPLREIGLYGDSVNYSHKIRLSTKNIFVNQRQVFFKALVKDQLHPVSDLPSERAIYSMKKYMSFERI